MSERAPIAAGLLLGWAADRAFGDPRRAHPVALFGQAMLAVEARLWRDDRAAGTAYAATGALLGAGPVLLADRALRRRPAARTGLVAAVTWAALGGRSLAAAGHDLATLIARDDLEGARALAPTLVGRDPATLDAAGLARAGLESVAENSSDAVVAPFVWGALLGAPGVALHRALNTMDAMVGHRSPRYERFGWAAARADDVAGWPAARGGAALTCLAAATVGGSAGGAWRTWRRDGHRHPSPNAGRVEAAFAGALGVRLGGRNVYGGRVEERPELGDGRAPEPADLERAARLSLRVGALAALAAAAVALRPGLRRGRR
ncbi:cobalamin biosynthesis protein [Patulibacter defluvii]|uniref:cobalamin biosynthesis protein n=1 Tax=Patulibacter defluvii TaxID=3095358 RepID=UPI002A75F0AD|nr:cobalamin biosynthesis protein [Patulibacter sp. DM4]